MAAPEEELVKKWKKTSRRLNKETEKFRKANKSYVQNIELELIGEDKKAVIKVTMKMPSSCRAYKNCTFRLCFDLPAGYPFVQPDKIYFNHKVWHPSVDINTGEICPDTLGTSTWAPTKKIMDITETMYKALNEINWDHPINMEAAEQGQTNMADFYKKSYKTSKSMIPL